MKTLWRTLLFTLLTVACASPVFGRARASGYCQQGGQTIAVIGYQSSAATPVERSYTGSGCNVLVLYSNGGGVAATGPSGIVNTSGTAVAWLAGNVFNANGQWTGLTITIASSSYTISTCASAISCTLTSSAGTQTSAAYSMSAATPAAIFSDNAGTPKSNPFAVSGTGYWFYYADNGSYANQYSGTAIPATYTNAALPLSDPSNLPNVIRWNATLGTTFAQQCTAAQAAPNTAIVIDTVAPVAAGFTASCPMLFYPGGLIQPAGGQVVAFTVLNAPLNTICDGSLGGTCNIVSANGWLYPEWEGAVSDGGTTTDCAMNSGSTTVTSASNPWGAAKVGQVFSIKGGAASGLQLITTIKIITNSGSLVLNAGNASGVNISGEGCTWGTDDHAALNAAVNNAGTQNVMLTGSYLDLTGTTGPFTAQGGVNIYSNWVVSVQSNTVVQGSGNSIVYLVGASGAGNSGGGDTNIVWWATAANSTNIKFNGVHFYGENVPFTPPAYYNASIGLFIGTSSGNVVFGQRSIIENTQGFAIVDQVSGSERIDVLDSTFSNLGSELNVSAASCFVLRNHFINARTESACTPSFDIGDNIFEPGLGNNVNGTMIAEGGQTGGSDICTGIIHDNVITVTGAYPLTSNGIAISNCVQGSLIANNTINGLSATQHGIQEVYVSPGPNTGNNTYIGNTMRSSGAEIGFYSQGGLGGSTLIANIATGFATFGADILTPNNVSIANTWDGVTAGIISGGTNNYTANDNLPTGGYLVTGGGTYAWPPPFIGTWPTLSITSNTIAPTDIVNFVGAGNITTITAPSGLLPGQCFQIWPLAAFTLSSTGGNIAKNSTAVVNQVMNLCFLGSPYGSIWSPSY